MAKEFEALKKFFGRDVCQKATKPLSTGSEMAVEMGSAQFTLRREKEALIVVDAPCSKPDLSFTLSLEAIEALDAEPTEDVGEMGVVLLKQMVHSDPTHRMGAKVHIGIFDLLRKGYLGVLPLGGPAVMKFLASKGLTSMGKIKEAVQKMKAEKR